MSAKRICVAAMLAAIAVASAVSETAFACSDDNCVQNNRPRRSAEPSPKTGDVEAVKPLTAPLPEAKKQPKPEAPAPRSACQGSSYCQ